MPEELVRLSPGEVRDLYEEWRDDQRRQDYRFGVIAAAMAGGSPLDYFSSLAELRPGPPSDEALEAKVDAVLGRWS